MQVSDCRGGEASSLYSYPLRVLQVLQEFGVDFETVSAVMTRAKRVRQRRRIFASSRDGKDGGAWRTGAGKGGRAH